MNQMWNDIWVKLSEDTMRKSILFDQKSKIEILDAPLKFPLILSLFHSNVIHITNKEQYEWIIELFENFENPKMINTYYGFNRNNDWDTRITLLNYREIMKMPEFSFKDLYNKIIDIAIEREINLAKIVTYAFIHEILELKDIRYIKSILFPWNKENDAEKMIMIWKDFTESKTFSYHDVVFIWDGMEIKEFMKLYAVLANQSVKIKVIAKKDLQSLDNFLNIVECLNKTEFLFKMSENYEFILWQLIMSSNLIKLRKWYYQSNLNYENVIELSNTVIKFSSESIISRLPRPSINLKSLIYIEFNFKQIDIKKRLIKRNNQINFDNNNIEFSSNSIHYWESVVNKANNSIYIFDKMISTESEYKVWFNYLYKEDRFCIRMTNKPLSKADIEHLIKMIKDIGYIYLIKVLIDDPSSAIEFLNYWNKLSFLKSIEMKIKKNWSIKQNYEIEEVMTKFIKQEKKWKIYRPSLQWNLKL